MVYELLRSKKIKDYEEAKKNFRQAQADYTKKRAVLVLKVNELQEKKAKYAKDEKSLIDYRLQYKNLLDNLFDQIRRCCTKILRV